MASPSPSQASSVPTEPAPGKVIFDCDLHLHSHYSMGVSKNMTIPVLAQQAARKGIGLVGASDITHPKWRGHLQEEAEEVAPGTYQLGPTRFILSGEVEDSRRVHHLILFPEVSAVEGFCETVAPHSSTLAKDGRPKLRITGEEVAQAALDVEALIGPAHAFTPWTAIYAYHDSLPECYGDLADQLAFVELGLSAESSYGDHVPELAGLTFLTNSDAHSPWPNKFAREFNRLHTSEATFQGVKEALLRQKGSQLVLNVGLPPQEGKYNRTACTRCYNHHTFPEAVARQWRCGCGGLIKKGVVDRVTELSGKRAGPTGKAGKAGKASKSGTASKAPEHRPPYQHLIPLGELIAKALGVANPNGKKVQREWELLVDRFGSEIAVAIDAPLEELVETAQTPVASALEAFRTGNYRMRPGGGGQYGEVILPISGERVQSPPSGKNGPEPRKGQLTLSQFQ